MTEKSMYDEKRFDKRLIERHLTNGLEAARITPEQLQAHLDGLPDLADKCEPVTVVQPMYDKPSVEGSDLPEEGV